MNVISLYDYTGEAVRPWAEAGYECYCYDIQHRHWDIRNPDATVKVGKGSITYLKADLHDPVVMDEIFGEHAFGGVFFLMAFPVCTDLAVSGAAHFAKKRAKNPRFQEEASDYAKMCADLAERFGCPYYVENPVSRLATLWRKPNHTFHPFEFGCHIPLDEAEHPRWPEHIAPRDGYSKKTCLWTSETFVFPEKCPVDCESFGASRQHKKLGGKSQKTKNIRSATPRGFARAVFEANCAEDVDLGAFDEYKLDPAEYRGADYGEA